MEQQGSEIFFGKVQLTGCEKLEIKKKPNGLFYAFIQTRYDPDTYKELSTMCWETKREPLKIVNPDGSILKDFHCYGLIMELNTVLKVDELVRNHVTIKMLNKIK
jgi:hypothetical protein